MKSEFKDFILYFIVGGIATLVEWAVFFCLDSVLSIHYTVATVIAYCISTFVNWAAGRLLVFKESNKSIIAEIISIYVAAVVGLLLNIAIMWILVDLLSVNDMLSKMIATALVFMYNYLIRKKLIYKKSDN